MAARAIWKGIIRFGSQRVPVKLYSATEDRSIRFHLLHDQDNVRLKQRLVNPKTNATVSYADASRGLEIERGLLIVLDKESLQTLEPAESRDIHITRFVSPELLDFPWYERPYYLGPDGDTADSYFALVDALRKQKVEGIAKWVMRRKAYLGALRAEKDHLMLITLRHAGRVIRAVELDPPEGRKLDKREQDLAEKLIEALADDFDPGEYRDEYRERVLELILNKSQGGTVAVNKYETKPEPKSLAKMLEASLASAK